MRTKSSKTSLLFRFNAEPFWRSFFRLSSGATGIIVALIFFFLAWGSSEFIFESGLTKFWQDSRWSPTAGEFNLLPILAGSVIATLGCIVLSYPLGLLVALAINFYLPKALSKTLRSLVELFTGVPSVVIGFWGLVVLVPMIAKVAQPGSSLLAVILVLGLMTLPIVTLTVDMSLQSIGRERWLSAVALGLPKWRVVFQIVLPEIKKPLLTAAVLQSGRALGETMAVLMVCGNIVRWPNDMFAPMRTLTSNIAIEMAYAVDVHRSSLFFSGLLLTLAVAFLFYWTSDLREAKR